MIRKWRRIAALFPLLLAACSTQNPQDAARASAESLIESFNVRDTAATLVAEKCALATQITHAFESGDEADVYDANHWRARRDAYCSKAPDRAKMNAVRAAIADLARADPSNTSNRCSAYSLVALAYKEARDASGYNEWRMKTRAYCDAAGWRWEV